MTAFLPFGRALALCALGSFAAGAAHAQASWDLDQCVKFGGSSCNDSGGSGVNVTVSAYDTTGAADTFNAAAFNVDSSNPYTWMGIKSKNSAGTLEGTDSPNHAIDNYGSGAAYGELVHLDFSKAVDLSQVIASWYNDVSGDSDFRVFRWNFNSLVPSPDISSFAPNQMPTSVGNAASGWQLVASGDFDPGAGGETTQGINDGTYYSSHWLITTKFGGGNDAFKLGTVNATGVCVGPNVTGAGGTCGPGGSGDSGVPEPATLAMVLLAGLGIRTARRQRRQA